jgi:hypothetical protein
MKLQLVGFTEAEALLKRLPYELREKYLKKAVEEATRNVVDRIRSGFPAPRRRTLTKAQRQRPRLRDRLGHRIRSYASGVLGIGGPYRGVTGKHAHLLERGFWLTRGGTWKSSDGKTRRAKDESRTHRGKRIKFVEGSPYVEPAFEAANPMVVSLVEESLRKFADEVANG